MSGGGSIRFVIPGAPKGKGVATVTKFGTFTPKKTEAEMEAVRLIARTAMNGRDPFGGPVELLIACYMPIPASWSKGKRALALSGHFKPTSKPDGSNIQKLVEDAIQPKPVRPKRKNGKIVVPRVPPPPVKVVLLDDAQIVRWTGWKIYSDNPRIVVQIKEIVPDAFSQ